MSELDRIKFPEAQRIFNKYIMCESRDPNGLNDTAKAMLAYSKVVTELTKALEFYADDCKYMDVQNYGDESTIDKDGGFIAEIALKELK